MRTDLRYFFGLLLVLLSAGLDCHLLASTTPAAQQALSKLLLGRDVKALIEMPAYKEGIDIYYTPPSGKRTDDRGIDLEGLSKWLKAKGVGVDKDDWVTITDVKVDSDKIEIHLGGGGEGRRGSNHANKVGAGYKRAGGSRINFRYGVKLTDAQLNSEAFLSFMGRVLDTSKVRDQLIVKELPTEFKSAIENKMVKEGMTYQMVMMSLGDPDQKKVDESSDTELRETWLYLKGGHRWVVRFENGKVSKLQIF